jgi:GxxExxY protein
MNSDGHKSDIDTVTKKIIGCAFTVANRLGCGFLKKVYENALVIELRKAGLCVAQQQLMEVRYDDVVVGTYVADLVVESVVLLEIKAVKLLDEVHTAQCLNYLKATALPLDQFRTTANRHQTIDPNDRCRVANKDQGRRSMTTRSPAPPYFLFSSYQRLSVFIRGSINQARHETSSCRPRNPERQLSD